MLRARELLHQRGLHVLGEKQSAFRGNLLRGQLVRQRRLRGRPLLRIKRVRFRVLTVRRIDG